MLRLKINEVLLTKGVLKPHAWLVNNCGFGRMKAHNLLENKQVSVRMLDLQKICVRLDCTPNELFWWEEKASTQLPESHSLVKNLAKPAPNPNWLDKVQDLSVEQAALLRKKLQELTEEGNSPTSNPTDSEDAIGIV